MQITQAYLERFATQVRKPAEIPLNGYEQPGTHAISIDDPDSTFLSVSYRDDYPSDAPWDIKEGAEMRETFMIVKRGADTVGSIGYRFAGLIKLDDLRSWYRKREGLTDGV
jgi:hypothetical protein